MAAQTRRQKANSALDVDLAAAEASAKGLTAFESEREERIRRNKARLASMGLLDQARLDDASFRIVKHSVPRRKPKTDRAKQGPLRSSSRLKGGAPENYGLADDFSDTATGKVNLADIDTSGLEAGPINEERRCDSQSRGSLYDSKAGITCHFCRQKKLCGEKDCPRCSTRNPDLQCIGKSECSKCGSANGRFCRACLKIRYGMELEDVREEMGQGKWLCPHCYEADHPNEGWICNSSICMSRRGLKPTGIAIYLAHEQGFASVAHQLQAKLLAKAAMAS